MWETQACILIFHVWSGIKFLFLWFACLIRLSLYTGCPSWRNRHHLSGLWTSGNFTLLCDLWWLVYFNGLHLINQNIAFLRVFFFPAWCFNEFLRRTLICIVTSLIRLLRLGRPPSWVLSLYQQLSCQSTIFAFFSYFLGSHFGHLSHFKALLWSTFGHVQTGVKIPQMVVKNKQMSNNNNDKKTPVVKYVLEQKYCSFFFF